MQPKKISIVIPAYNEASNLALLVSRIDAAMKPLPYLYEFIFIDDGSTDNTLEELKKLADTSDTIFYAQLSRNFGHQQALKCGMDLAAGDCIITLDADLQHPPEVLPLLIQKWEEGYDVVYTIREEDSTLPFFKRKSSSLFYILINKLSDIKIEDGAADFRLLDKAASAAFSRFNETELFIRGMVKWMGFRQTHISYKPNNRHAGKSKYSYAKMIALALQAVTSFSIKPLTIALTLGVFFFLLSLLYLPYIVISYLSGMAISGWASVMVTIIFFGGLQLLMIGIIGLYVGKITLQTKHRPQYFIRHTNYTQR